MQAISTQPGSTYNHTYSGSGPYVITVGAQHYDSINNVSICYSTDTQSVYFPPIPCLTTISQVSNGGGSWTFTANNVGQGSGITYTWNFGDGSPTVQGSPVTHTYTASGSYAVVVTAVSSTCQYSHTSVVNYFNGNLNCSSLAANFTSSGSGYTKTFNNTSTYINNVPGAYIVRHSLWNFGDGSTGATMQNTIPHTYMNPGVYTVTMVNNWTDSVSNQIYCSDTVTNTVTVTAPPPPPNIISGYVFWDSLASNATNQASFKVWLIAHDATANTLTAVDSTTTSGFYAASYSFSGHPAGTYRTKAAPFAGTAAAAVLMPTYHDTSLYWNTAQVIVHTGGSSTNRNILMKSGTGTTGPGFIGGNISQGANKGTGAGVPNMLVALLDANNNQTVRFTYTDGNGDYSFGNIALGTYTIFPESINYLTTPASNLVVASGQTTVNGINFKQTSSEIKPIPQSVNDVTANGMFSVYPNPTAGMMTINWKSGMAEQATVNVVDMTGRVVMSEDVTTNSASKLNIGYLTNGVYFIKVSNSAGQYTEKVVLQH